MLMPSRDLRWVLSRDCVYLCRIRQGELKGKENVLFIVILFLESRYHVGWNMEGGSVPSRALLSQEQHLFAKKVLASLLQPPSVPPSKQDYCPQGYAKCSKHPFKAPAFLSIVFPRILVK